MFNSYCKKAVFIMILERFWIWILFWSNLKPTDQNLNGQCPQRIKKREMGKKRVKWQNVTYSSKMFSWFCPYPNLNSYFWIRHCLIVKILSLFVIGCTLRLLISFSLFICQFLRSYGQYVLVIFTFDFHTYSPR